MIVKGFTCLLQKLQNIVSSSTLKVFPSIGKFKNHDIETKREALRRRIEAERIRKEEEERKIKEQIAKEKEDGEKI